VKLARGLVALAALSLVVGSAPRALAGGGHVVGTLPDPHATAHALTPDRIREALVTVQVGGHATGIGVVLENDGRMLTSLSAVGPHDAADVRYPNGHVVHARAMHKDPVLDLALLVPMSGRYKTGLLASELDPMTVQLRTAALAGARPSLVPVKLKSRIDAHAKDGTSLSGAWELDHAPPAGAPLLDPDGRALGIAGRACRGVAAGTCNPVTVVIPILSIRIFLSHTPATAVPPSPWLGINGVPDAVNGIRGVRIQAVAPRSPAQRSGLHTQTDLIVVADGQPLDTPERLAEIVSKHAVGDVLKLSVFSHGRYREVDVTLGPPP
jgi:serine protease Do